MTHRVWKKRAAAVLTGAAVAIGAGQLTAADPSGPGDLPKAGETITLKFSGQPERKVTVVKATRKPDGSVETQVKDPKTGETLTLTDPAPHTTPTSTKPTTPTSTKPTTPASPKAAHPNTHSVKTAGGVAAQPGEGTQPPANREPILPRIIRPRSEDATPTTAEPPRERRILGRLFGRDQADTAPDAGSANPDGKRGGLLNRLFGPRKPDTVPTTPAPVNSGVNRSPVAPVVPSTPIVTTPSGEPPRSTAKPITPPPPPVRVTPVVPPVPAIPVPLPLPGPGSVPPIPAPPATPSPAPYLGSSAAPAGVAHVGAPAPAVRSVSYTTTAATRAEELRPLAATLKDADSPAARLTAAKGLADGRHGSSVQVKGLLFAAAQNDPAPAVRAGCIEHLCRLGYYDPAFLKYLETAGQDSSDEVRNAAKSVLARMTPRP